MNDSLRRAALLLAIVLIAAASCRTVRRLAADPTPVRVLVYNIHAGKDASGADNLERVAALIEATRADIVLLQEVDRGTERSGGVDQIATLAGLTDMDLSFGCTLDYQGGEYGIATLSRWPIVGDSLIPLPVDPAQARAGGSHEPRGALHTEVNAPGGTLHVLNTHLDASGDDSYRRQEVARLLLAAARLRAGEDILILGGDFNATPESEVIAHVTRSALRDGWADCGGMRPGNTYPADDPIKRIDYLFIPPAVNCDSAIVLDTGASDHRPVFFQLDVLFTVEETVGLQRRIRIDSTGGRPD
ncbi:MAG: endonuclease/exonuclease/phosphatase family protein [Gemmatimonadaceae bacterium]